MNIHPDCALPMQGNTNSEPTCQQKNDTYDHDLSGVLGCIMERIETFIELMASHCEEHGHIDVTPVKHVGIAMIRAANKDISTLLNLIWEKIGPIDVHYKRGVMSSGDELIDMTARANDRL